MKRCQRGHISLDGKHSHQDLINVQQQEKLQFYFSPFYSSKSKMKHKPQGNQASLVHCWQKDSLTFISSSDIIALWTFTTFPCTFPWDAQISIAGHIFRIKDAALLVLYILNGMKFKKEKCQVLYLGQSIAGQSTALGMNNWRAAQQGGAWAARDSRFSMSKQACPDNKGAKCFVGCTKHNIASQKRWFPCYI